MTELTDWLPTQRWYASKSLEISGTEVFDAATLADAHTVDVVTVAFANGTHALYQLVPELARGIPEAIAAGEEIPTDQGTFCFRRLDEGLELTDPALRPMGLEQSNSSIVVDERYVLKVFRKLDAGINPELEMLRFLSERGYPNIAALRGWYEYNSPQLAATLGVLQDFIPDGRDGWKLALDEIPTAPERFLERAASLGDATAELHSVLGTDAEDPAFAPEEPSAESVALLRARIDEDIERMFQSLPELDVLAPIASRGMDVRERLQELPQITTLGRFIRHHGDYHLGQTLARPDGTWVLLDFEGEPARPVNERRMKRSALRDVASMLRSFDYAIAAVRKQRNQTAPDGLLDRAREAFLTAYLARVDQSLMPAGEPAIHNLLSIFELEKAIYELRYELNHRPDWVEIPVSGIERLLEAS